MGNLLLHETHRLENLVRYGQKSEVRSQRSEVRGQRSEVSCGGSLAVRRSSFGGGRALKLEIFCAGGTLARVVSYWRSLVSEFGLKSQCAKVERDFSALFFIALGRGCWRCCRAGLLHVNQVVRELRAVPHMGQTGSTFRTFVHVQIAGQSCQIFDSVGVGAEGKAHQRPCEPNPSMYSGFVLRSEHPSVPQPNNPSRTIAA
jgi:hypothetical protein